MLETIEKLLLLQDRDCKIHRVQQELVQIGPERDTYHTKATATQARSNRQDLSSNKSTLTANGWKLTLE